MAYQQVKKPNLKTKGRLEWCLEYAQNFFGVPHTSPSAWAEWLSIPKAKKHAGTPPKGVWVPIFFSGYGGLGHVAGYKDGQIYSSPWQRGTDHAVLNSIKEMERIYGVKYEGWSEVLGGQSVIKSVPDPKPAPKPKPTFRIAVPVARIRGQANTKSKVVGLTRLGKAFAILKTVQGEKVNGNSKWYQVGNGRYISATVTNKK